MRRSVFSNRKSLILAAASSVVIAITIAIASPTLAAGEAEPFDIAEQPLSKALLEFSEQTDIVVVAPRELVNGKSAAPVQGDMAPSEALAKILDGTGLNYTQGAGGGFTIVQTAALNEEGRGERGFLRLAQAGTQSGRSVSDRDAPARMQTDTIDMIIVTAQRREQDIKDVPQSVFALSNQQLVAQRIEDFDNLGLVVPGLSVIDLGGIGQQRIYMRGLGNIVGDSLVGVYLDDISAVTSAVDQLNLRTYDLERVEVLKGPQGTLFGQGSVGGTVRFITKNPDLTAFGGRADASVSFTEDGAPSQDIKAVVNIPLVEDKLGIRVSGVFENAGGWIDQPLAQLEDINDSTVTSVRAKVLFEPTDAFQLLGTVVVFDLDGGLAGTDGLGNIDNNEFEQVFGLLSTPSRKENYEIYSLTGTYDFGPVSLVSVTSHVDLETSIRNYTGGPDSLDYGLNTLQDLDRLASNFTQEVRLSSEGDGDLNWLLGGIYTEVESGDGFVWQFGPTEGPTLGSFEDNSPVQKTELSESWAVFGEGAYEFGDRFELGAGFRYFENEKTEGDENDTFSTFSPRAFAKFALTASANIYANAGKGFRSGGFSIGTTYGPESAWSYDLGSKGFLFDGLVDYDVAVFYTRIEDFQIVSAVPGSAFPLIENGGVAEITGLEWNIGLGLTDRLNLNAHGTVLDPVLDESEFPGQPLLEGDQLDFVPNYHFGFNATYQFDLAGRPGTFTLNYNKKDRILRTVRNSFYSTESESGVIDMLSLNIDWTYSDSVSIGIFASNLTNESDRPTPVGDDTIFRDTVDGTGLVGTGFSGALPLRPRTYGFSVSLEF